MWENLLNAMSVTVGIVFGLVVAAGIVTIAGTLAEWIGNAVVDKGKK